MRFQSMIRSLFFLLCLLFFQWQAKAEGGDALERMIRLPKIKGTVYILLQKVSTESGYLFIYDSKLVRNDLEVKVKAGSRTLRQAIYEILGDERLLLKVVGNHILITRSQEKQESLASMITRETDNFTLTGKLLDRQTGEPIANASILLRGTSTGNITNQNGEFKLHLADSLKTSSVTFSHLGYMMQEVEVASLLGCNNVLTLEPKIIPLQEVLIRLVEPKKLLREMLAQRATNYIQEPVYLTTFYREGVQLKNKFQQLTEAVFKVYKPSLFNTVTNEQVKLLKMSRLSNLEVKDSLAIKITAGIRACLELDIIKYIPDFLSLDSPNNVYIYTSGDIAYVGNRSAHVVYFEQRADIREPLLCGALYIDSENSALLQARLEINPHYVKKAANMFIVKSARNIYMIPQKVVYTISYRPWEDAYYAYHVRGDLYFKSKRKKYSLSSTTFHTWFEMVTCKVEKENVSSFPKTDRIPTHTILSDVKFKYDDNFWEDFNVIPLEENIQQIIERVSLKIEKTGY